MVELRVGNSDQRYQDLVETIKEGILELDQDGCIVFASPPLLKMLDKPSGSLLGQEASEFLNAESISVWREHAHRLPASKCENFVIELLRNDGSLLPVSLSMRVCVDHRGGEGSFCVVSDLTEAQHANQLVRWILNSTASLTGEEFFQALMRNVAEAFCFRYAFITECMDISQTRVRTLVYWNGQDFEPNFEFDLAETPCGATIHGAQTYFVSRGLANVFPYTAALGVEGYLGIPLFDTTFKTVIGHIAFLSRGEIAMDVVEHPFFKIFASRTGAELRRKRAEEQARTVLQQLAHLSRVNSLGEMASGIAHELSQPLSALQTFAHASLRLIASGASSIEELQHTLTRVVVQADRMGEILRRIRSLSKKEEVERRALDVNLLIEEIVDLLSFDAQQSSIEGSATFFL